MKSISVCSAAALALMLAVAPVAQAKPAKPGARASQPANAAQRQLQQLMKDYYLSVARFEPMGATFMGDNRFDDQLGMSIGPKQIARQYADYRKFSTRLKAIRPEALSSADRISYDILDYTLASALAGEPFPDHLMPVDPSGGMPTALANLASGDNSQPITTPKQYRAYLSRVRQLSDWIEQAIANMREGIKSGVVQSKALTATAIPKYDKLISATPEASVFYTPITKLPAGFSAADKAALTRAYRDEIANQLNPALVRMAAFLKEEYLPAGRDTAGYGALPNGRAWYAQRVAAQTTTTLTPEQIHQIGLQEVARIQQQFAELGPKLGYTGAPAGLPRWMSEQPKYRPFKSEEEILAFYRALDQRLAPKLAGMFTLLPKAPLEQRLEPELTRASASDHYGPPASDGSRPGIFWSVVNDPTTYDSTRMTTLYLHEGRPGHHFQIALQLERPLPDFRKFNYIVAYGEGWGLYAESLGKELGVFEAPDQYFGHLNAELLRAVRLVVDTGLHEQGWTREQAMAYMRETLGHSEAVAKIAAERYMAWPGQALAYKIGQMKISELRQNAAAALGPRFVLSEFHRVVLEDGAMPLAVLEQKVKRWVESTRASGTQ
ncbi:MAG: DUF885 domain-containing protein [Pseudomonadota bacterium]